MGIVAGKAAVLLDNGVQLPLLGRVIVTLQTERRDTADRAPTLSLQGPTSLRHHDHHGTKNNHPHPKVNEELSVTWSFRTIHRDTQRIQVEQLHRWEEGRSTVPG
jgi:hypothetical protein